MSSLSVLLAALLVLFSLCSVLGQDLTPNAQSGVSMTVVSNTGGGGGAAPYLTASLCFIWFSQPGNVEYPWTTSISLTITYTASSTPNAVQLVNATGTRSYSNKYGGLPVFRTPITLAKVTPRQNNNLLYTNGSVVDGLGIGYANAVPVAYPGAGPLRLYASAGIYSLGSGLIVDGNSNLIDNSSISITSSIPNFVPVTMGCPFNYKLVSNRTVSAAFPQHRSSVATPY